MKVKSSLAQTKCVTVDLSRCLWPQDDDANQQKGLRVLKKRVRQQSFPKESLHQPFCTRCLMSGECLQHDFPLLSGEFTVGCCGVESFRFESGRDKIRFFSCCWTFLIFLKEKYNLRCLLEEIDPLDSLSCVYILYEGRVGLFSNCWHSIQQTCSLPIAYGFLYFFSVQFFCR